MDLSSKIYSDFDFLQGDNEGSYTSGIIDILL